MRRAALEPADYPFFDYRRFTFSLGITVGDTAWLSGSTASRFDPASAKIVVEGSDLIAQSRVIFEKMRLTLEAGGLGFSHIVRLVEYVTPAAVPELPRLAAFRGDVFKSAAPAISTIVVSNLLRSEALIEIEAVATRGRHAIEYLQSVSAPSAAEALAGAESLLRSRGLTWPNVVKRAQFLAPAAAGESAAFGDGKHMGLSVVMARLLDGNARVQLELAAARTPKPGIVFAAATGDPGAGDVVGQCRDAYARIGAELAAAGSGLGRVVKTTEFVTPAGLAAYRKTADVRRDVFSPPYPAATGVVCERLLSDGAQIAVEVTAVKE